jgi:hypothetical protein
MFPHLALPMLPGQACDPSGGAHSSVVKVLQIA